MTEKYDHFLGGNGKISGKRLFHEKADLDDKIKQRCPFYLAIYSKPRLEENGMRSAYRIFMDADSEYDAAIELVGEWALWVKLCEYRWFVEGLESKTDHIGLNTWREHKAFKIEQEGIAGLRKAAKEGNVSASKELIAVAKRQMGEVKKVGRPKKEEDDDFSVESSVSDIFKNRKV